MVLRALEHPDAGPMDVRISMELLIRRSCGCAPAAASARPATTRAAAVGSPRVR
jgi:hypothetical protein